MSRQISVRVMKLMKVVLNPRAVLVSQGGDGKRWSLIRTAPMLAKRSVILFCPAVLGCRGLCGVENGVAGAGVAKIGR